MGTGSGNICKKDFEPVQRLITNRRIEKITIGEPQDMDGERIQEVKIYYKFIGCISQEGHIC